MILQETTLTTLDALFWVTIGILFSVIIPIASKVLLNPGPPGTNGYNRIKQNIGRNWVLICIAAFIIGSFFVITEIIMPESVPVAVLEGFTWQSILIKFSGKEETG
jgi:hypothetical protein